MSATSLFTELNVIAEKKPDQVALLDSNERQVSYQQLLMLVERAHAWLNSLGLKAGDSLIALLPNAIETAILFLASLRGGFIYAPLPCTATLPEISRWKKRVRAQVCLLANPVNHTIQAQIKALDWHAEMISIGGELHWPDCENFPAEKTGTLVMQSSGSTGEPKAIVLSGDRLWASAKAFLRYHSAEKANIRFWNYLPMSYLGGLFNLTLIPLASEGSAFIDDAFNGKTFLGFWNTVERFELNGIWLVPSVLRGLLALSNRIGQKRVYPKIHYCFLGTAPILLAEKKRFAEIFGLQPLENYGLSETTFISSERADNISVRSEGSVGSIMPDVEIQLRPTKNHEEKIVTEIWVKTPYAMLGYLNEEGLCEAQYDDHGFMPTGDFGEMLNGQLRVTGRYRDIIKKGGVLILLREIEHLVSAFPKVKEVAAVKVDHPFYGESFDLYLCIEESVGDENQFYNELNAWLHKQLIKDKWPEKIILQRDFPRTSSGKVQKHLLGKTPYAKCDAH
jgi:acyl-coenzyme A synthetase/AMP-(fatty) acid ligase